MGIDKSQFLNDKVLLGLCFNILIKVQTCKSFCNSLQFLFEIFTLHQPHL